MPRWAIAVALLIAAFAAIVAAYELGRDRGGSRGDQPAQRVSDYRQALQTTPVLFAELWPDSVTLYGDVRRGKASAGVRERAEQLASAYDVVAARFAGIASRSAELDLSPLLVTQFEDLARTSELAQESAAAYAAAIARADESLTSTGADRFRRARSLLVLVNERLPRLAREQGVDLGGGSRGS